MFLKQIGFLAIFIPFLGPVPPAMADTTWTARVVWVLDGDSLIVKRGQKKITIRVAGIDAPEKNQPWADAAKKFAIRRAKGRSVTVRVKELDHYGRTVAHLFFENGDHFGTMMIEAGLAWWYRRYSRDATLEMAEKKARREKIGLWSEPQPIPPWIWKRRHPREGRKH